MDVKIEKTAPVYLNTVIDLFLPVCPAGVSECYRSGNRTLYLTIAPPVAMTGSQNPAIANWLVEVFSFDMTLAGPKLRQP